MKSLPNNASVRRKPKNVARLRPVALVLLSLPVHQRLPSPVDLHASAAPVVVGASEKRLEKLASQPRLPQSPLPQHRLPPLLLQLLQPLPQHLRPLRPNPRLPRRALTCLCTCAAGSVLALLPPPQNTFWKPHHLPPAVLDGGQLEPVVLVVRRTVPLAHDTQPLAVASHAKVQSHLPVAQHRSKRRVELSQVAEPPLCRAERRVLLVAPRHLPLVVRTGLACSRGTSRSSKCV